MVMGVVDMGWLELEDEKSGCERESGYRVKRREEERRMLAS